MSKLRNLYRNLIFSNYSTKFKVCFKLLLFSTEPALLRGGDLYVIYSFSGLPGVLVTLRFLSTFELAKSPSRNSVCACVSLLSNVTISFTYPINIIPAIS